MWSGIMFVLSNHLALRNNSKELEVKAISVVTKTVENDNISTEYLGAIEVKRRVQDPLENCTARTSSCDTDTTSESGSAPNSTDSLHTYYMPTEEIEVDFSTQDREGKTLTITPSFNLLASLSDTMTSGTAGDGNLMEKQITKTLQNSNATSSPFGRTSVVGVKGERGGERGGAAAVSSAATTLATDDEDWSDFIVLDTMDEMKNDNEDDGGRKLNNSFLQSSYDGNLVNEIEENNLDDEGLRRRNPKKTDKKVKKSPVKLRREKDKKSSESLNEMNTAVRKALSHRDLLSTLLRVNSTKFSGKKTSNTWMSKITGTENGRPLMFRVGSTCMTMSNLVNENRDRGGSPKNEREK